MAIGFSKITQRRNIFLGCLLFLITLSAYSNTFRAPFVYDDLTFIVNNPALAEPISLDSLSRAAYGQKTRVVGFLTFALNYQAHRLDVTGYHIVNLAIHLINVLLVWFLVRLSYPQVFHSRGGEWIAFFAAAFFAVHPLQTQAVTYITQRIASLATLFYLSSLYCYGCGRLKADSNLRRIFYFAASLLLGLLGLFTKEIVITLPLSMILFEVFFVRSHNFKINFSKIAVTAGIFAGAAFILTRIFTFSRAAAMLFEPVVSKSHEGDIFTFGTFALTQLRAVATLLRLFIFPVDQNFLYDFPMSQSVCEAPVLISLGVIAALLGTACVLRTRSPLVTYGIFWFFLTVSVEFIPRSHVIWEYKLYLTSVGLCIALSAALSHIIKDQRKFLIVCISLVGILTVMTFQRNKIYESKISLWEDIAKRPTPRTEVYLNLAEAYYSAGDWGKAIEAYTQVIALDPRSDRAYSNRGLVFQQMGRHDLAMADYTAAVMLQAGDGAVYVNRGSLFQKMGKLDEALADYNHIIDEGSNNLNALNNRGSLYLQKGELVLAQADFEKAVGINRDFAAGYINLGTVYHKQGRTDQALENYRRALDIQPDNVSALYNRALVYIQEKQFEPALKDLNKVLRLDPNREPAYLQRAKVNFHLKQFRQGIEDCSRLIQRNPQQAAAYYFRAVIRYETGDFAKAYQDLLQAEALGHAAPADFKAIVKEKAGIK